MNLFNRLHDLFLANAHQSIDLAENPETMIKQVLREMDAKIREARAAVVSAVASEKQLAAELERHRARSRELARQAESAVTVDREQLAEQLLLRKVEIDRVAAGIDQSWRSTRNTCSNLKAGLEALLAKRSDMLRRQQSLAALQRSAYARKKLCHTLASVEVPETTDEKFERMQARVTELEAESLAVCEVFEETPAVEAEAKDLEASLQVDVELQAIKARCLARSSDADTEGGTKR